MDEFCAGLNNQKESLRSEALNFTTRVDRSPAVSADQQVIWFGLMFDYTQFLNDVRLHFLNRPDAAYNTHNILKGLVHDYQHGLCSRSRLHSDVCILFIGHADLFNRFERLRFFNDGREETHHQIREWRDSIRNDIMAAVSEVLGYFLSAIGKLGRMPTPERLDSQNLDFIKKTCFPMGFDRDDHIQIDVMVNLVIDPAKVRHHVLPTLKEKHLQFWRLDRFLANYFGLVASGGL